MIFYNGFDVLMIMSRYFFLDDHDNARSLVCQLCGCGQNEEEIKNERESRGDGIQMVSN
jgi:hypothetical protein